MKIQILLVSLTFYSLHSAGHEAPPPVLEGASFFVVESPESPLNPTAHSYYTYQGIFLGTHWRGTYQLDPQAPKPQVTNCEFSPAQGSKPCRIIFTVGKSVQRLMFNYDPKTRGIARPENPNKPCAQLSSGTCFAAIQEQLGIDTTMLEGDKQTRFRQALQTYNKSQK